MNTLNAKKQSWVCSIFCHTKGGWLTTPQIPMCGWGVELSPPQLFRAGTGDRVPSVYAARAPLSLQYVEDNSLVEGGKEFWGKIDCGQLSRFFLRREAREYMEKRLED